MKAIKTDLIITSFRGLTDRSLSLTCHTPELSTKEKALFMELQGLNCEALFEPKDEPSEEYKVEREVETKSPGQRLRAVLFVYWDQQGRPGEFDVFYKAEVEKVINSIKSRLE